MVFHVVFFSLFCIDSATTEIYTCCHTLSLHDALPIWSRHRSRRRRSPRCRCRRGCGIRRCPPRVKGPRCPRRSEEHTSELQSLMRISYAVLCLKKKNTSMRSNNVRVRDEREITICFTEETYEN